MKHAQKSRSKCPINYSLEMFGDAWSLLVIRDIVYFGKKTYGDFIDSEEKIARNILANRLVQLEEHGIIIKKPHPDDGRKEIYGLTESGLDLIPLLIDSADWGAYHSPSTDAPMWWIELVRKHRDEVISRARETVRAGGSMFIGDNSVAAQLHHLAPKNDA